MSWRVRSLQAFPTSQTCSRVRICYLSQVQTAEVELRHVRVKLYLEYDYDNILDTAGAGDLRADFPTKPSTGELELRLVKEHWNLDNCVVSTGAFT